MVALTSLDIRGHRGEPVPNAWYRQDDERMRSVAVVLPGMGYTAQMPVLWYPRRLCLAEGMDVLTVDYSYMGRPEFTQWGPEQDEWLRDDVGAAFDALIEAQPYDDVVLIGKSLGTLAMGALLAGEEMPAITRAVWLTPLLGRDLLRDQIRGWGGQSLFVIGTDDPHYRPDRIEEVSSSRSEALILERADHSLEVPGDVTRSVEYMQRQVQAIGAFLEVTAAV